VLVLERSELGRDKVCGEGLMPHGRSALASLGVEGVDGAPFRGIAWHLDEIVARGTFPRGEVGLGVRRDLLDASVARLAEAHPAVHFERGRRVGRLERSPDGVVVGSGTERWSGRVVVGADGIHSAVRRLLGLDAAARGRKRFGLRARYSLQGRAPEWVSVHAAVGAEAYLTPVGPAEVNIALLLEREAAQGLRGDLAGKASELIGRFGALASLLDGAELNTEPAVCGPLRREARRLVLDRAVLVGDAAGFLDGITGEGMSLALRGAEIASEVLSAALHADDLSERRLAPYPQQWNREIRDQVRLTEVILWGIRHRRLARRAVGALARRPELFGRLLAVQTGQRPLSSVGLGGVARLLWGR